MLKIPQTGNMAIPTRETLTFEHIRTLLANELVSTKTDKDKVDDLQRQMRETAKRHVADLVSARLNRDYGLFDLIRQRSAGIFEIFTDVSVETYPSAIPTTSLVDGDNKFFIHEKQIFCLQSSTNSVKCISQGPLSFITKFFHKTEYIKLFIDTERHIFYALSTTSLDVYSTISFAFLYSIQGVYSAISDLISKSGKDDLSVQAILPLSSAVSNVFSSIIVFSYKFIGYVTGTKIAFLKNTMIEETIICASINLNSILIGTVDRVYLFIESEDMSLIRNDDMFLVGGIAVKATRAVPQKSNLAYPLEDISFLIEDCSDGTDETFEGRNSKVETDVPSTVSEGTTPNLPKRWIITVKGCATLIEEAECLAIQTLKDVFEEYINTFGNVGEACFAYAALTSKNRSIVDAVECVRNECSTIDGLFELLFRVVKRIWKLDIYGEYFGDDEHILECIKDYTEDSQDIQKVGINEVASICLDLVKAMKTVGPLYKRQNTMSVEEYIRTGKKDVYQKVIYDKLVEKIVNEQGCECLTGVLKDKKCGFFDKAMEAKLKVERAVFMMGKSEADVESDRTVYGGEIFSAVTAAEIDVEPIEEDLVTNGMSDIYVALLMKWMKKGEKESESKLESLRRVMRNVFVPLNNMKDSLRKNTLSDDNLYNIRMNCVDTVSQSGNEDALRVVYDVMVEKNEISLILSSPLQFAKSYIEEKCPELLWRWYITRGRTDEGVLCLLKLTVEDIYKQEINVDNVVMKKPSDITTRLRLINEGVGIGMGCSTRLQQEISKAYKILSIMNSVCRKVVSIEELLQTASKLHQFDVVFIVLLFYTTASENYLYRTLMIFLEYAWSHGQTEFKREVDILAAETAGSVPSYVIDQFVKAKLND
ncbi:hypothetical protein EIN_327920 [Entamoeba invadens IP1]|uniref:Uncharacterized protein n=1 Tax=Entamoeba invadens IP1 TaxID=370355 RepID=A0A0A1TXP4_ENTIV|nr:hypothetical protein EIN_327920 [Entamoeba invadens IP1]ELP86135.1 hypothetical protein EIN_327920 [Entamoeba invadens IP1]|eukprot:XP_004185481.1 hypothetical protein EIN_327920 [Entamoeba invadens IP1]